jgi:hypothetical protein
VKRRRLESWKEAAEALGVEVVSPPQHAERWRRSLQPNSEFARLLDQQVESGALVAAALDAATGLGLEVERLQRACLGSVWPARKSEFLLRCRALRLDQSPPPGVSADAWCALKALVEHGSEDRKAVAAALPDEWELLLEFERRDPAGYELLYREALERVAELEEAPRRRLLEAKRDLDSGSAFRTAWRRVFGKDAGIQPAAPRHLAALVLGEAGLRVRETGLFLAYSGLTQTAFEPGMSSEARLARLTSLDNEVHNARKVWRSAGHAGLREGLESPPGVLIDFVEWLTWERTAETRSEPQRSPASP